MTEQYVEALTPDGVVAGTLDALLHCPASDPNWGHALSQANAATCRAALAAERLTKTARAKLETRLRGIERDILSMAPTSPGFARALELADLPLLEALRPKIPLAEIDRTDAVLARMMGLDGMARRAIRLNPALETPMPTNETPESATERLLRLPVRTGEPGSEEWLEIAQAASYAELCWAFERTDDPDKRDALGYWITQREQDDPGPLPSVGALIGQPEPVAVDLLPNGEPLTDRDRENLAMLHAIPMRFEVLPDLPAPAAVGAEPYDQARVISECRVFMGQSAEAMLEAGKRLIRIKENEAHGEFERIVEHDLNLNPRTAQLMMAAAAKFLGPALAGPKAQTFSLLGKSKLFELMTEPDEDLAELAQGGTLAGLKLEDIDRMSVRELKKALREQRAESEAKLTETQAQLEAARNLGKKHVGRIHELEEELELRPKAQAPTPEMVGRKAQMTLNDLTLKIVAMIKTEFLRDAGAVLAAETPRSIQGETAVGMAGGQIMAAMRDVCRDLEVLPAEDVRDAFAEAAGDLERERVRAAFPGAGLTVGA